MKKLLLLSIVISFSKHQLLAHCQVPCGIYNDATRIINMIEDYKTIEKAMAKIVELSKAHDPASKNQIVRWVNTKDEHATNIQNTVADYFMAQRLKESSTKYIDQLALLHKILVTSMECKQTIDQKNPKRGLELVNSFSKIYLDKHGTKHLKELTGSGE
tara:strand:+ start:1240 stop:1716 length:477 start_codon:yes stop_codon:yes gene_type:complete